MKDLMEHFIDDQGILTIRFKKQVNIEIDDAIELTKVWIDTCEETPRCFLIDGRQVRANVSLGAFRHFARDEEFQSLIASYAIIVDSLPIRLLANLYISVFEKKTPAKIFDNEPDALVWLQQFL
ncbi:MAG: hypothetical protein IH946_01780 [Bacteroidetes bacterium]|nr:hypothetical protein [Bacteroidota bacterium]